MKEIITIALAAIVVFVTGIFATTYYHVKKDEALKSSIESAIVKGIDPMAVRCAYGASDSVCLVYSATVGKK